MAEKLLNTREVSQYLGISEEHLRKLVDIGKLPAYRLGGTILRFRKDQIDEIKARGIPKITNSEEEIVAASGYNKSAGFRDFLYFNDFYILSVFIIIVLLAIIFFY